MISLPNGHHDSIYTNRKEVWGTSTMETKPGIGDSFNFVNCFSVLMSFLETYVGSAWSFVFSSSPQRTITSDFKGFSIPDFIHYIYFPILILEKEPVFPVLMFSAKQENYWYHFYNVFGMTRSLTGNWTRDFRHSKPALNHFIQWENCKNTISIESNIQT